MSLFPTLLRLVQIRTDRAKNGQDNMLIFLMPDEFCLFPASLTNTLTIIQENTGSRHAHVAAVLRMNDFE